MQRHEYCVWYIIKYDGTNMDRRGGYKCARIPIAHSLHTSRN